MLFYKKSARNKIRVLSYFLLRYSFFPAMMAAQEARDRKVSSGASLLEAIATGTFVPAIRPNPLAPALCSSTLTSRLPDMRFGATIPSNSPQYGQS